MLEGILSISGKSGLFKLVSQGRNAIIVESLADGKRMPVSGSARVSALQEISMYTVDGDVKLSHVMANIYKLTDGKECIPATSSNADRIYVSDIKKLVAWYNILLAHNLVSDKEEEEVAEEVKSEA